MNTDAIDMAIENTKQLLTLNKIDEAIVVLQKEIAPISKDLETPIILNAGSYKSLKQKNMSGMITSESFQVESNQIKHRLIGVMGMVDDELKVKKMMDEFSTIYSVTSEDDLQRIHGSGNNLKSMSWIYKMIEASRCVCQVVRSDGNKGTGWMMEDGWMMTNFHVIPNQDWVMKSKIVFDYEDDLTGNGRKTSEFELDPEGAIFSSIRNYDYAYIKVKNNAENSLSQWGHLEIEDFQEPKKDDRVSIIQHPKGEKKQIALTENKVINVDGHKIFYLTDTEKGSSGSPVLNDDWKVVALHHAGRTEEDGGLVIDSETGERRGANEGIMIRDIIKDIKRQQAENE